METYEFHCGGDRGAWECIVDVQLTSEEVAILKSFAQSADDEFLIWDPPMDKIYSKVLLGLEKQCDGDFDADTVVIRFPYGLKGM